jgi:hypothetical protein
VPKRSRLAEEKSLVRFSNGKETKWRPFEIRTLKVSGKLPFKNRTVRFSDVTVSEYHTPKLLWGTLDVKVKPAFMHDMVGHF